MPENPATFKMVTIEQIATTTYEISNGVTSDQADYIVTLLIVIAVILGLGLLRGLLQLFTNRR